MLPVVEHLLKSLAPRLSRAAIESARPDLLPRMVRTDAAWQAFTVELGFPCPEALVELGRAAENHLIHIDDSHGWDLLSPKEAHETRQFLEKLAGRYPELARRCRMAPVFGQDGDLLLLAPDGRVWMFTHDDWEHDEVVTESFDQLIVALTERKRLARF